MHQEFYPPHHQVPPPASEVEEAPPKTKDKFDTTEKEDRAGLAALFSSHETLVPLGQRAAPVPREEGS